MRLAIVGHRGLGKTSLLRRIEDIYSDEGKALRAFDLDREIEFHSGRTIQDVFHKDGEEAFRLLEKTVLDKIEAETTRGEGDVVVVCGAGFDPSRLSNAWKVLWVRRMTDGQGRIFTDRPRLNRDVTPLEEYLERFEFREKRFAARADETLWLDEGLEDANDPAERDFVLDRFQNLECAVTVLPENFRTDIGAWIERRVRWGYAWFELRDDLLSEDQIREALKTIPNQKALVSFRDRMRETQTAFLVDGLSLNFDWPLEWGDCPHGAPRYLSFHERTGSLKEALAKFPKSSDARTQLKAALPIRDLSELELAHRWQTADPEKRIFLPMSLKGSKTGRWAWYRALRADDYSLNFIREAGGSSVDQPTLLQWARRKALHAKHFAALLGDPVHHSRTPLEHAAFFREKGVAIYAIAIPEAEATKETLGFLRELGLRWAAVTSPLKHFAFQSCQGLSDRAEELKAVNTLVFDDVHGVWAGTNTDLDGFKEAVRLLGEDVQEPIAIWGGGGTLEVVRKVLPQAEAFSVRTGENRVSGSTDKGYSPKTVVWAVGRSRDMNPPPATWKPALVIDLNYSDDSPGREFALERGAAYESGLAMFKAQAVVQRAFWEVTSNE